MTAPIAAIGAVTASGSTGAASALGSITAPTAATMPAVSASSGSGFSNILTQALGTLQKAGYWCVGLDETGPRPLAALDLTGRTAIVLGAEGAGLRRLTAERCDDLARLPTGGPIRSLNVSNAAAVALYELARGRNRS